MRQDEKKEVSWVAKMSHEMFQLILSKESIGTFYNASSQPTGLCKVTGYFRTPLNSYIHGVILKTIWHGKSHNWLVLFGVWQWVISGQVPL